MATYYFRSGSSLWNNTSSWSTSSPSGSSASVIPTSSDDVLFISGSGISCLVATSAGNCKTLNTSTYAGTISLNAALNVFGNITLGTLTVLSGSSALVCASSSILSSSGNTTINCPFTLSNSGLSNTYTLADNWTLNGTFSTSATAGALTHTINGNNIYCKSNLSINGGSFSAASLTTGSTVINMIGSGSITQSPTTTGGLGNSLVFNSSGSIILPNILYYRGGPLKYITGSLSGSCSALITGDFTADMTNGGSNTYITPFNISGSNSSNATITMLSDWYINGISWSNFNLTINGYSLYTTGSIVSNGNAYLSGTSVLRLKGNSSGQNIYTVNGTIGFDLSLEAGANQINIITLNYTPKSGGSTVTYISGAVNATGTFTISGPNNVTLNTSGVNWNNITYTGASFTTNLNSALNVNGTSSFGVNNYTFSGSNGFTTNTLVWNTTPTTINTGIVLASGLTYTITNNLILYSATIPTYLGIKSSNSGSAAFFILNFNASQTVGNVQPTDINSSNGQTVAVWQPGPLNNTTNWVVLSKPVTYVSTF